MTTYHAIATPTLQPSLKSARRCLDVGQPVQIVASGTPEECYEKLRSINALSTVPAIDDGEEPRPISLQEMLSGLVSANPDWTYRIVADKSTGEPRAQVEARAEQRAVEKKYAIESARRSMTEWFESARHNHQRAIADLDRRQGDFEQALSNAAAGEKSFASPADVLSWIVNDCSNARNNMREDLLVARAAELAKVLLMAHKSKLPPRPTARRAATAHAAEIERYRAKVYNFGWASCGADGLTSKTSLGTLSTDWDPRRKRYIHTWEN